MKPHIYVVGIGPGSLQGMTLEAKAVLEGCDCIVGYHTYIDLIRDYFPDKEFVVTGMTQEVARCRLVLERAFKARTWPLSPAATPASTAWPASCTKWLPTRRTLKSTSFPA